MAPDGSGAARRAYRALFEPVIGPQEGPPDGDQGARGYLSRRDRSGPGA